MEGWWPGLRVPLISLGEGAFSAGGALFLGPRYCGGLRDQVTLAVPLTESRRAGSTASAVGSQAAGRLAPSVRLGSRQAIGVLSVRLGSGERRRERSNFTGEKVPLYPLREGVAPEVLRCARLQDAVEECRSPEAANDDLVGPFEVEAQQR